MIESCTKRVKRPVIIHAKQDFGNMHVYRKVFLICCTVHQVFQDTTKVTKLTHNNWKLACASAMIVSMYFRNLNLKSLYKRGNVNMKQLLANTGACTSTRNHNLPQPVLKYSPLRLKSLSRKCTEDPRYASHLENAKLWTQLTV